VTVQGNASITVTGTNTVTAPTTAFVGNITATGEITAGFGGADSVTLQKHEHPTTPDGPMAPPVPGT
jgi:phage baseplate assembly protein gpV